MLKKFEWARIGSVFFFQLSDYTGQKRAALFLLTNIVSAPSMWIIWNIQDFTSWVNKLPIIYKIFAIQISMLIYNLAIFSRLVNKVVHGLVPSGK